VPKRPTLSSRAQEFAASDASAARPDPTLHGEAPPQVTVIELPLREIMPNPHQPRLRFEESALEELAQSIREHGVIQPIIVKAIPAARWEGAVRRYELIAGERRWRASERAGRTTVPAILREDASTTDLIELALIENLQRADLAPLEEAAAFAQMQQELRYTYDQIGARVGKSKGYVMNRMRLLRLDDDLRDLVAERPSTLSHIIHLEKLSADQRGDLIAAVRDEELSLAEVRREVERRRAPILVDEVPAEVTPVAPTGEHAGESKPGLAEPAFLRKNDLLGHAAPPAGAAPFLRKNEQQSPEATRAVLKRDIAHIRAVVQRWQQLPDPPAEERPEVLAALDGLVGDLEDAMRRLQGREHNM